MLCNIFCSCYNWNKCWCCCDNLHHFWYWGLCILQKDSEEIQVSLLHSFTSKQSKVNNHMTPIFISLKRWFTCSPELRFDNPVYTKTTDPIEANGSGGSLLPFRLKKSQSNKVCSGILHESVRLAVWRMSTPLFVTSESSGFRYR